MTKSRWAHWSRGTEEKLGFGSFTEAMDTGNPTGTGTMSPAERARQLGLQSDGSGGYIDPASGEVVARTVNGELVFYDHRGATGGVVSDGAGGQQLANAQPSWSDPKTGMLTTPPAQPESPEEIAAVPDATPAVAPMGYMDFMKRKKEQAYANPEPEEQEQPAEMGGVPAMAGEISMGEDYTPADLRQRVTPEKPAQKSFSDMRKQLNQTQNNTSSVTPERQQQLQQRLGGLSQEVDKKHGVGANLMSMDDLNALKGYVKNGPAFQPEEINDDELDFAMKHLKESSGKKWTGFQNRLKGKGAPPADLKTVARGREVVRSYLAHLGQSDVDGSPLAFSESELDHGTSLANGGEDVADNWRWLPRRFNQFKGDLEDDALLEKIEKEIARQNSPDFQIKQRENEFANIIRSDWKNRFDTEGWEDMNAADIREKKGEQGIQFLKALANINGLSYWKQRPTRASGRPGGATSMTAPELQEMLIDKLGIPEERDIETFDRALFELLQKQEDERSELDSMKRARRREKLDLKKKISEEHDPVESVPGTSGKERIPLYAMKRHVVDQKPIDDDFTKDIQDTYPNDANKNNINSARAHAANFNNLLDERKVTPEARKRLRFGRVGEAMPEFEGADDTRVGDRMNRIFREMNPEVRDRLYNSPDVNAWNPTDIYAIDGDYEDEFLSGIEQLKTQFADDDEAFVKAVNALGRRAVNNGQYFPISLKEIVEADGEGQSIPENVKDYVESPEDSAILSMLNNKGVRMNLDLLGQGFQSNSLNIPVQLGMDGGDYRFDMRFQEPGGAGSFQVDPRKNYRSEPQPMKPGSLDRRKYKILGTDKPKEVNADARKYQLKPDYTPTAAQQKAIDKQNNGEELTRAEQGRVQAAADKQRKVNDENEKRIKALRDDQQKYEKDLLDFESRVQEAEDNREYTTDSDSKIGMVPTNYLREWVSDLLDDETQLRDLGIEEGEEEMRQFSPKVSQQRLIDTYGDVLNMSDSEIDRLGLNGTQRRTLAALKRDRDAFNEKESQRDRRTVTPRDFNETERQNLRNMLTSLYNYQGDENFSIDTPDVRLGNKSYTKDNIGDYIDDLLDMEQELRKPAEERPFMQQLFGDRQDFGDDAQFQARIRLALMRLKITNALKDAHIRGDLPKRIAQAYIKGSKTKSNDFFPYYKMEKKRKTIDESFDWQETQYLIYL